MKHGSLLGAARFAARIWRCGRAENGFSSDENLLLEAPASSVRGENMQAAEFEHLQSGARCAMDLFIEDGAYTTVASAVAILLVLALLFSSVAAVWSMARAGDVQTVADATALAGSNVVSSYFTAATVVDASIASLGFAGMAATGVGLVGLLIPGARAGAAKAIDAGIRLLDARNSFASSASKGLKTLESSLPFLIAANGSKLCLTSATDVSSFYGTALAVPAASASEFPALNGEGVDTQALQDASDQLDQVAQELEEAGEKTAQAKERAWIADCGREGYNMQERAAQLTELSGGDNPDYQSSVAWDPVVGIKRTRVYYRWRLDHEQPEGNSTEAAAQSAARRAFYRYAYAQFEHAGISEYNGSMASTVPTLPRNTREVRNTTLFTESVWPTSQESDGLTLHYGRDCPGFTGTAGPIVSFAAAEGGLARECDVCHFSLSSVGEVPAASTSIDNGYEYHLNEFTLALNDYVTYRNQELELERRAQGEAETAADAFDNALEALSGMRPRIAPPGRYGCVAAVVASAVEAPESLESSFATVADVGTRGAISASVLAKDTATKENNVLSRFFSTLEERTSSTGLAGLAGNVMELWGSLLISYGDMGEGLSAKFEQLVGAVGSSGTVGTWLKKRLSTAVSALSLQPVDLSLKKPVLTDSSKVIAHADVPAVAKIQECLRSIPIGTTDPTAITQAIGYELGEYVASQEFTLAEIPLPGGGSIPLTIRLRDIVATGGDS